MAAIKASLALFNEVGMPSLIKKSKQLTGYLEYLILKLNNKNISIITPKDPKQRRKTQCLSLSSSLEVLSEV
jgi:kynureninase